MVMKGEGSTMDSSFLPWGTGWVEVSLTTPERQREARSWLLGLQLRPS